MFIFYFYIPSKSFCICECFKLCNLWEIRKSYNNRVHRLLWNWNVAIRSLTQQDAFPYTVRDPPFVKYPPAQASNIVIFFFNLAESRSISTDSMKQKPCWFLKGSKSWGPTGNSSLTKFLLNPLQQISCVY